MPGIQPVSVNGGDINMKRLLALALALVLLLPLLPTGMAVSADTYVPSRVINLVYDDSGSMIIDNNNKYVDTWCQAKYAMEVFAGMLGEKETLNIYYMSDYQKGPLLRLQGSKDARQTEANVKKIHDLVTKALGTPFGTVRRAYDDLKSVKADEQWLVVLTDGEFLDAKNAQVEDYFHQVVKDGKTKVMMLSMGAAAAVINQDPANNIYFEKAANSTDILSKITTICNRIFQSNVLPISGNSVSFNVPMSQLVVFAQGKDVKITGITGSNGQTVTPSSNVHVQYSRKAATNNNPGEYGDDKVIVADNLNGYVATFNTDFVPGQYTVNVSGADTVQVYYKPNVSIAAYLYNADNEEVTAKDNLVAGTYRLEFGFIDATNGQKVTDTSLLGNITYDATMTNTTETGDKKTSKAKSGDTVTILDGKLDIAVSARFLEYNTVKANLSYTVYRQSGLYFTFEQKPTYTLGTTGFANPNDPIVVTTLIDGENGKVPLTEEQWKLLGTPTVTTEFEDIGAFRVEKTNEIGKFKIYPTLKDGDPMATHGGAIPIAITGGFKQGMSSASGEARDTFTINDTISGWERFMDWLEENWLKLTLWILAILLILGYLPPFKKYLPRKVKNKPYIKCMAIKIGVHDLDAKGTYRRNLASTLIPYKAETGSLSFTPPPRKVCKLKAAGKNRMTVVNTKTFAGKSDITFDGVSVPKDEKRPIHISSHSILSAKTAEYNYICYLNR